MKDNKVLSADVILFFCNVISQSLYRHATCDETCDGLCNKKTQKNLVMNKIINKLVINM